MSTQTNQAPSQEEIRNARRSGFGRSVAHMPEDKMKRLAQSYAKQDSRREKNVADFYATVLGDRK